MTQQIAHVRTGRAGAIEGRGVFAVVPLRKGHRVGVYEGRRMSAAQFADHLVPTDRTYFFMLSNGDVIDGSQGGNVLRLLNHSCAPNCEFVEVRRSLLCRTLRRIEADEELTIDYSLDITAEDDPAEYACQCGAEACRGTMVAPEVAEA